MADASTKPAGSQPPPKVTYRNPRRTSPENSITLRHHRLGREGSKMNSPIVVPKVSITDSTRRHSSDESNETAASDPMRWFDRSNERPNAGVAAMDVDPPFFQKETDSSNEDDRLVPSQSPAYRMLQNRNQSGLLRPGLTHSSSADDYRSIVDDLTIENKRLREELKRYKQMGPDSLRREKLFEVKVHGLPSRKRRELEATLRDFTTSLDGSSAGASPSRRKDKSKGMSKHAWSSSGSNSRRNITDSAYASMSTGAGSSDPSLPRRLSRQKSDMAVEQYLQDVPEGLWPQSSLLTEKAKKKLVVRRLEQLFTGKGLNKQPSAATVPPAIGEEVEMSGTSDVKVVPSHLPSVEPNREAQILPGPRQKESHSRGNRSASNSNEDQADSREIGSGSGSGFNENETSPPDDKLPEQRPTRPRDLDPDRTQVPSENMDYIRHLGVTAPETHRQYSAKDVSPDADGWVYLNLLGNLAQLHILNVTPAFIRSAVAEKSTQFQLSPDGRKIRWRGGEENTKFSSDSSGSNSQHGQSSPDSDGSNAHDQRKKQKTQLATGNDVTSEPSKFAQQVSSSDDSFHYKPMFVHQQTSCSDDQPSLGDETGSSCGQQDESNLGMNSRWNQSGVSRVSQRKRRRDGAIIYYTGAPFCTDLSGDLGDVSTDSYNMTSSGNEPPAMQGPGFRRSDSGSSIPFKPLSNYVSHRAMMDLDFAPPEASTPSDESDLSDEIDGELTWSDSTQTCKLTNFEASGLGGVTPDDHFVVVVSTRRPKCVQKNEPPQRPKPVERRSDDSALSRDTTESIAGRLALMSTGSPQQMQGYQTVEPQVAIEYLTGKVQRLPPTPLPPPTFFFGSSDKTYSSSESDSESDDDAVISRRLIYRPGQPFSANGELSSNDEEDEHSDDADEYDDSGSTSPDKLGELKRSGAVPSIGRRSTQMSLSKMTTGSSVATAGGAISGYSSMGDL
ncbi:hypothetical protein JX265_012260 [Neoarthrinium moseri]|uniref:Frequency clock protein n=1 Tax=Neoarthrinium moseri TaxID=1658444 RepID=A0A9P9WAY1_9PEZI|nr:hypothetical protein JX265_012260 [Neoarthrinium moseri]